MSDGTVDRPFVSACLPESLTRRIQYLRDLDAFFGVRFKVQPQKGNDDASSGEVIMSCVGIGFSNVNKAMA